MDGGNVKVILTSKLLVLQGSMINDVHIEKKKKKSEKVKVGVNYLL